MSEEIKNSTLYLISTPIGNLEDITLRALKILGNVDILLCENTNVTSGLLQKYNLSPKKILSYFEHNELKRIPEVIEFLKNGNSVALVSDAGTPLISDPGFKLVREVIKNNFEVVSIPGANAAISALSISGLPTDSFVFEGFLPTKKGRNTKFEFLKNETRTIIFYESPHRILKTLNDIKEKFGEREIVVARELTKKFEEILRGNVGEIISVLQQRQTIKGEFVIVVRGKAKI